MRGGENTHTKKNTTLEFDDLFFSVWDACVEYNIECEDALKNPNERILRLF